MIRPNQHKQRLQRFCVGLALAACLLPGAAGTIVWLGSVVTPHLALGWLALLGTLVSGVLALPLLGWAWVYLASLGRAKSTEAEAIIRQATEGILTISKRGEVIALNPAAEHLFGYHSDEVLNRPITMLLTESPSQEQQNLFHDSLPVGTILGLAAGAREMIGKRKNGETFPLELTISSLTTQDDQPINVAFVRDVSKRKRAQRYLTAHYAATCILAESQSLTEALPRILRAICETAHWEVGAFWQYDAEAQLFRGAELFSAPLADLTGMPALADLTSKPGMGLVGRAGAERVPVWVENLAGPEEDVCVALAQATRQKVALAFPILVGSEVWGVMTFFSGRKQKRTDQMLSVMAELGKQLSQFVIRKRDEEMLHQSEERFRQLAENIHDVFWMADAEKEAILYVSPSCEMVWGRPASTLQCARRSALEYVHAEDRARVQQLWERQLLGENTGAEYRVVQPEGTVRWVWDRAFPIRSATGGVYRIAGITADITERKRTEEKLQETTQTLQALVQAAPVAITITDLEGKVRLWNPGAERIFGWTRDEVLGQALPVHPSSPADSPSARRSRQGDQVSFTTSFRCRRKDLSEIDISQSTAPLRENGSVFGIMSIMADLTAQKRLEEQLRQSQKMEAVGQLAGGVAHDFNNLLTVISGFCELLLARAQPADGARDGLEQIRKSAERAAALTRQLLAFGRKQTLQVRILDLNTILRDLRKMLPRLIGEDIELVIKEGSGLGQVKADPVQIEQILLNLGANARDAMPNGGTLTLATANVELSGDALPPDVAPGAYVMLSATDTGCGMDAITRAHVFEPFFTTKEVGKGTGLGLATIYGIIKQSQGHIEVESEPNCGSTFRIYLPRLLEAATRPADQGKPAAMPSGSETVLLVEDDEGVRRLVHEVLRMNGYTVFQAGSAAEALQICEERKNQIDALITDVIMPRMNGRQLADRALQLQPKLKVLYISGYTDRVLDCDLGQGTAFLQKPITPDRLARKVRELLDVTAG